MNGRKFFLNLAVIFLFFLLIVSTVPPVRGQTFASVEWKYADEDDVWIRRLDRHGTTATLTLHKLDSKLVFGITIPCRAPKRTATYTWMQGELIGKSKTGCDDFATVIEAAKWENVFEPIPPELLGPPPAEIFINPENPQIIA